VSRVTVFDLPQHVRRPLEGIAQVAGAAIVFAGLMCAIEAALLFARAAAINDAAASAEKYRLATTGTLPISVASFCVAAASLVGLFMWLAWQYRAQANLWAAGLRVRYAPPWSVMWWFVPAADLWMPAVTMTDLWRGSAHGAGDEGASTWRVWLWWWPFLIGFLVRIVGHGIRAAGMFAAEVPSASPGDPGISAADVVGFVRVGTLTAGIGDVMLVVATPLALFVLRGVTRRQATITEAGKVLQPAPPRPDR
jgi:hypothetical protein